MKTISFKHFQSLILSFPSFSLLPNTPESENPSTKSYGTLPLCELGAKQIRENKNIIGTTHYASCNTHLGIGSVQKSSSGVCFLPSLFPFTYILSVT
ncbi:hypothetical protein K2173_023110 [Erythroxylum novogranatense]|uniref:Uncharacterized protein n=1 Tax=Erythroxylum novogranatense TaxID=1862640 RepID=A0AAV8T863_9ROSI|nr:hypothetical protein K2173_023110 [Erythroxylum novogranatense]